MAIQEYEFYDPHPGFAGAEIPIPTPVKTVADNLNGKRMTLAEAVKKIQAVTKGIVKVVDEYSYISLTMTERDGSFNAYKVISFRKTLQSVKPA